MEHQERRHHKHHIKRFDFNKAAKLDDRSRLDYLSTVSILSILNAPNEATIVDFGTGTGFYAIEIGRMRQDLSIIALDIQEEMLNILRNKPDLKKLKNIHPLLVKDANAYVGRVDRILCINTFHELEDDEIINMLKMLKPNGSALIIDWNKESERSFGPSASHTYNPSEARTRLERLDLKVNPVDMCFQYHYALLLTN